MKHRLYIAAAVVLADVFALGAVWHVTPTLGLTAGLAVPAVEQMLSPLYPDPVREDVTGAELHRPARPRSVLVLTGDAAPADGRVRAIARALARRDIAVLVPASAAATEPTLAHARTLGVPVRVERAARFHQDTAASTLTTRAAHAWQLLRLAHGLLAAR